MKAVSTKSSPLIALLLQACLFLQPVASAAKYQQWSPPGQTRNTAVRDPWPDAGNLVFRASTASDPWTKPTEDPWTKSGNVDSRTNPTTTPDPWTRPTPDPWTNSGSGVNSRTNPTTTPDPWTRPTSDPWTNSESGVNSRTNPTTTPDPWTRPTSDPWTNSGSGVNSRTNPTTTPDPWTRPTPDPWTNSGSVVNSRTNPTTTPDPWTKPKNPTPTPYTRNPTGSTPTPYARNPTGTTPDFETIDTINVISSNYFSSRPDTGRLGGASGSTDSCQRAINECSLFGVEPAALDNVYQAAFATLLRKQQLTHQANLKKARDLFINLFNQFMMNPDTFADSQPCAGANVPVLMQNDPANTLTDARSILDVNVPPLEPCVVSEWSEWSLPLAFGTVERSRSILRPGQCCPRPDELLEQVNITSYLNQNNNAFENPNNVAENFNNDFLSNEPRDILLVIDTSSSIYVDDFEVMKDGIKTMIDLFCGGFGYEQTQNRLAILQFSNSPVIIHYFNDPQSPEELKAKVNQMVDFGGKTCTGDALIMAHDEIFTVQNGARAYMPNETLIVTDGHANCGANLLKSAEILATRSRSIYSLGIGIAGDVTARAQVTSLVTNQDPHHIFSLARYMDFKEMVDYIKYRQDGQKCTPILRQTDSGGYQ